jgi:predicted transcriptional regulator
MPRTSGSTAARLAEIREWLADQLERGPTTPNEALVDALTIKHTISVSRARELVREAREKRKRQQIQHTSWEETQQNHCAQLKDLRDELLAVAYAAKLEGNYRQQILALREAREISRELLTYAPSREETFKNQSEHRAALKAAKEAHLQDPPPF